MSSDDSAASAQGAVMVEDSEIRFHLGSKRPRSDTETPVTSEPSRTEASAVSVKRFASASLLSNLVSYDFDDEDAYGDASTSSSTNSEGSSSGAVENAPFTVLGREDLGKTGCVGDTETKQLQPQQQQQQTTDENEDDDEDEDEGEDDDPCEVCHKRQAIYTCPGCRHRTCSVPCVQEHKRALACDGIRPKFQTRLRLKDMNEDDLFDDVSFLAEVGRRCGDATRDRSVVADTVPTTTTTLTSSSIGGVHQHHQHHHQQQETTATRFRHLLTQCRARRIQLRLSPPGMAAHAQNNSRYCFQDRTIYWRIKFVFLSAKVPAPPSSSSTTSPSSLTFTSSVPSAMVPGTWFVAPFLLPETATWRQCLDLFLSRVMPVFAQPPPPKELQQQQKQQQHAKTMANAPAQHVKQHVKQQKQNKSQEPFSSTSSSLSSSSSSSPLQQDSSIGASNAPSASSSSNIPLSSADISAAPAPLSSPLPPTASPPVAPPVPASSLRRRWDTSRLVVSNTGSRHLLVDYVAVHNQTSSSSTANAPASAPASVEAEAVAATASTADAEATSASSESMSGAKDASSSTFSTLPSSLPHAQQEQQQEQQDLQEQLRVFLRLPSPANAPSFVEFPQSVTVRQSLAGVTVQDFPVVFVALPGPEAARFTKRLEKVNDVCINWTKIGKIELLS